MVVEPDSSCPTTIAVDQSVDLRSAGEPRSEDLVDSVDALLMFLSEPTAREELAVSVVAKVGTVAPAPANEWSVSAAHVDTYRTDPEMLEAVKKLEGQLSALSKLQELCASIDQRLALTEETLRRTEGFVSDRSLQQLSARINARLAETEDAVRRIERLVARGTFQDLSTRIDGRLVQADLALRRIEGVLETRALTVPVAAGERWPAANRAGLWLNAATQRLAALLVNATLVRLHHARRVIRPMFSTARAVPWGLAVAKRGLPALVLLGVLAIVSIVKSPLNQAGSPTIAATPTPTIAATPTPTIAATPTPTIAATPTDPPVVDVASANSVAAPVKPIATPVARPISESDAAPARSQYVGALSITSAPRGARVFVGGRAVGETPLLLKGQRAGSVAVQITSDGFERWSAAVHVPAGTTTRVNATLQRIRPE